MPRTNHERVEFIRRSYAEGTPVSEIASQLGVTTSAVYMIMHRHSIAGRRPEETRALNGYQAPKTFWQLADEQWLRSRYEAGRTVQSLAAEIGCSTAPVSKALKQFGVSIRPAGSHLKGRKSNSSKREDGTPSDYHSGYTRVFVNGRMVAEHRYVAEQALGRPLRKGEHVHHLNLNRADNRAENLLVLPSNRAHRLFHLNPPAWVPRCECCGHPLHEKVEGRPEGVPILYEA